MIYFISDTHYGHSNITGPTISKWKSGYRDFDSIEEMNQAIVDSINSTVGENDTLYHCGDWSFGGKDNIWNFRKQLICKDIRLILGNHDHHIKNNIQLPNCHFDGMGDIADGPNVDPDIIPCESGYVDAKQLFTSVNNYEEFYYQKTLFCLFHYPISSWYQLGKGSINIYGHCHHNYPAKGKQIDVGWCKWRRPLSIDEVIEKMSQQEIVLVDHHE